MPTRSSCCGRPSRPPRAGSLPPVTVTVPEERTGGDVRYWLRLLASVFRSMLDVAMLVVGSGLVSLGIVVLLDGFGLVSVRLGLSTGGMLATALVLGIVGAFAFGVASEGWFGASTGPMPRTPEHVAVARVVSSVAIGWLLWFGARRLTDLVADLAYPIAVGQEVVRATGVSGMMVVPLVGVGGAYLLHRSLRRAGFGSDVELGMIYFVWVLATVAGLVFP